MKIRLLIEYMVYWLLSTILATGVGIFVVSPGHRLDMILPIGIPVAILGAILYTVIGIKIEKDRKSLGETP